MNEWIWLENHFFFRWKFDNCGSFLDNFFLEFSRPIPFWKILAESIHWFHDHKISLLLLLLFLVFCFVLFPMPMACGISQARNSNSHLCSDNARSLIGCDTRELFKVIFCLVNQSHFFPRTSIQYWLIVNLRNC